MKLSILYIISAEGRTFNRDKFFWSAEKNRISRYCLRASLEDCNRGKSLGRIDGCSCSSWYYRFLSTRQRPRRCACIRDFIQPCEGPSVAGGGTNGTSAGGPGPSPNTTTLHHITQRTPARTYYPCRRHWLQHA